MEFEEIHVDESKFRPFHHARIVVTDLGQHEDGSRLTKHSTGRIFDRYGAKEFDENGNIIMNIDVIEQPELYKGVRDGYSSKYMGFTLLQFNEIQKIGTPNL